MRQAASAPRGLILRDAVPAQGQLLGTSARLVVFVPTGVLRRRKDGARTTLLERRSGRPARSQEHDLAECCLALVLIADRTPRLVLSGHTICLIFCSTSAARQACVVATREAAMTPDQVATTAAACLKEISLKHVSAAAIARGAVTCAESGDALAAVRIALEVEPLLHEANTLLNAASLMNRLSEGGAEPG